MSFYSIERFFPDVTFELRKNKGQRTLRLSVAPNKVRISVPKGVSDAAIQEFIENNKEWIAKSLSKQEHRSKLTDSIQSRLQHEVFLRGKWKALTSDETLSKIVETDDSLIFPTSIENINTADIALKWQRTIAAKELKMKVHFWSVELKIDFQKVSVRNQKSKWGSCSSKGNISLNWRLIKTPDFVRDYIIVHELVHRKHMNHSDKFWSYLEQVYPRTNEAEKWIKTQGKTAFVDP